jgi:hypothetical protein
MADIVISTSLIKALFLKNTLREDVCMKKVKALHFDGAESIPTESMNYGLYFETKALGESARGQTLHDLERKLNGTKTAIQERLDTQIDMLKLGLIEHFIQIVPKVNTQVEVWKRWNEDVILRVTFDIFPTPILYNGEILSIAAVDLKTTKDLDSDFGEYCWGRPEDMDHTQLVMQHYVVKEFDIKLNQEKSPYIFERGLIRQERLDALNNLPVFYWVFEHGTKMRNTLIKVNVDNTKLAELKETIRKVSTLIWECNRDGWDVKPSYSNCKNCPLNYLNGGLCKQAQVIREV